MPKKLVCIIRSIFRWRWSRVGRELIALGLLGLDLIGTPELYDALGLFVKRDTRGLSSKELALINNLLPDSSLPVHLIKIDPSAKLTAGSLKIAYVSVFTINYDQGLSEQTFVHELIHVWQYHRFGSEYIVQAIAAQHSEEGYDYGGAEKLFEAYGKSQEMLDFNFEQQGDILVDFYLIKKDFQQNPTPRNTHLIEVYRYFVNQLNSIKVYRW